MRVEDICLCRTPLLVAFGLVLFLDPAIDRDGVNDALADVTITVQNAVLGQTMTYVGATEAGGFYIDDLTDLGINAYRLWTKMAELEWWDDDDAIDGKWDDSEYGTPTIATIKADQSNNFANVIPWSWWDSRFQETQNWRFGVKTREGIISALVNNNIAPIVVLRTYDNDGEPEQRPAAQWAPRPPVDTSFRNEWWEHAFAIAYWLNVRNSYGVTRFEVLNEPDYNCQGWCNTSCPNFSDDFCGDQGEYVQLVQDAYDAVKYANDLSGVQTYIHAPVVASYDSPYMDYSLDNADSAIQVVDYHTYATDPASTISSVKSTITAHNPDGVNEPIWVSECGALWSSYNTLARALLTADQLITFAEGGVEGVTVFNMYDWSTDAGGDYGLIDLQDDGQGGASRVRTETYYAYRLMTRGLKNAKNRLAFNVSGLGSSGRAMVTRDADYLYVIVKNGNGPVTVDISAMSGYGGAPTIYEYSAANKDAIVTTPTVINGQFTFTAPASGLSLAQVPTLQPIAVTVSSFNATAKCGMVELSWTTESEIKTIGFSLLRSVQPARDYRRINAELIPTKGGAFQGASYTYLDRSVTNGARYFYKLEEMAFDGARNAHGPVSATPGRLSIKKPHDRAVVASGDSPVFEWTSDGAAALYVEFSTNEMFGPSDTIRLSVRAASKGVGSSRNRASDSGATKLRKGAWRRILKMAAQNGDPLYWRVTGEVVGLGGETASNIHRFSVQPSRIHLVFPRDGVSFSPKSPLTFAWRGDGVGNCVVEVSPNQSFLRRNTVRVRAPRGKFSAVVTTRVWRRLPKLVGTSDERLYWRVKGRELSSPKEVISDETRWLRLNQTETK